MQRRGVWLLQHALAVAVTRDDEDALKLHASSLAEVRNASRLKLQ